MVWQKKAGIPDYVNALMRMRLAITGTGDDWMLPWLNLLADSTTMDVNAFCGDGPPPASDLGPLDFLPGLIGGALGAAVTTLGLQPKINARAREVLFATMCENVLTTGEHDVLIGRFTAGDGGGGNFVSGYGWTIPAGCHKIKATVVSYPGSNMGWHWVGYASGSNIANPEPGNPQFKTVGQTATATWSAAITTVGMYSGEVGSVVDVYWVLPGSIEEHVPDALPQPETAIPPTAGDYPDIAALGAELDSIETKLHWVLNFVMGQLTNQINPLGAPGAPEPADDDEDIPLGPDVMGFIVYVDNIGNQTDETFGDPLVLHRLGRIVMGNGDSWLAPIPITVSPMLVLKPDPSITVCRVSVVPPATASVQPLIRPELVG